MNYNPNYIPYQTSVPVPTWGTPLPAITSAECPPGFHVRYVPLDQGCFIFEENEYSSDSSSSSGTTDRIGDDFIPYISMNRFGVVKLNFTDNDAVIWGPSYRD